MNNNYLVEQEIIFFHKFITQWFRGETQNREVLLDELLKGFHPHFRMKGASGNEMSYIDFTNWLPTAFGLFPDKEITLSGIQIFSTPNHGVAEYIETQRANGQTTHRKSSAIFVIENNTPQWYHLLEEWI